VAVRWAVAGDCSRGPLAGRRGAHPSARDPAALGPHPSARAPAALGPQRPQGARSALRADCIALLAAGAHGPTRCAACGRYAQTVAVSQKTGRAARAAPAAALLIAPHGTAAGPAQPGLV